MVVKQCLFQEGLNEISVYSGWLQDDPIDLFEALKNTVLWQSRQITLFGRAHTIPRLESFVGEQGVAYGYSAARYEANGWPVALQTSMVALSAQLGWQPNAALLNYYRNGADSMGWHADDEPEMGREPTVAILSLGATRDLRFRRRDDHKTVLNAKLDAGSLLLMSGNIQHQWQHALPKRANAGERISCTFRKIRTEG